MEPEKNVGGRPRKVIDLALVERLATIGCTHEEIGYMLSVTCDTLVKYPGFSESFKKGDAAGKQSLRHKQYQVAAQGNVVMLIWLGKQRLGQKNIMITQHEGEVTVHDGAKERLASKLAAGTIPGDRTEDGNQLVN